MRSISTEYLQNSADLAAFYTHSPLSPDWEAIIAAKKDFPMSRRIVLQEVLRKQYEHQPISPKTAAHIEALSQENTFCITTGHQLGLLGGPLFTVYKICSVIRMAEDLQKKFPNYHFVPLLWMHSEDHDFAEVNHFFTDFSHKISYSTASSGAVGRQILGEEIADLVANFQNQGGKFWTAGKSWVQAFREMMQAWFDDYGLVLLNPDEAALKNLFQPVLKEELLDSPTEKKLLETNTKLHSLDFPTQIEPKPVNLFWMEGNLRNRIEKNEEGYLVRGTEIRFSEAEMLEKVEKEPQNFSPNVCLRPVFQEYILPNLTYIGGWGELSYWLQLKSVFTHFKTPFPLLLPRFSATIFEEAAMEIWTNLGFSPRDIKKKLHELEEELFAKTADAAKFEQVAKKILAGWQEMAEASEAYDKARSAQSFEKKSQHLLESLRKKWLREVRKRDARFQQLAQIKQKVQPDGYVQERSLSVAALSISPDKFIQKVLEKCEPLDFSAQIILVD